MDVTVENHQIGDFGLSRVVQERVSAHATLTTNLGTPSYMAPELLSYDASGVRISGEAADVLLLFDDAPRARRRELWPG